MGKGVGAGPTLHIAAGITSRGFQPFKDFNWHVDEQVSVPEIPPNPVPILSAKNAALVLLVISNIFNTLIASSAQFYVFAFDTAS